jgi:hypothetical protein
LAGKVVVHWVEENCDDEGQVVTTMRHLAAMMSGDHGKTKVNRMRAWRALQEAVAAGILRTEALQDPLQGAGHSPTRITRVNFKTYQDRDEASGTGTVTAIVSDAGLSSRGLQIAVVSAAAPQASGRWPLGEQLRRLVGQGLCIIGPGGDGLKPPTSTEERDRLEADLAKVGVEAAAASCIESAKRNGKGSGISSLRYFLAHVHDIAQPAAALPEPRRGKPSCTAPAEVHTFTGEIAF